MLQNIVVRVALDPVLELTEEAFADVPEAAIAASLAAVTAVLEGDEPGSIPLPAGQATNIVVLARLFRKLFTPGASLVQVGALSGGLPVVAAIRPGVEQMLTVVAVGAPRSQATPPYLVLQGWIVPRDEAEEPEWHAAAVPCAAADGWITANLATAIAPWGLVELWNVAVPRFHGGWRTPLEERPDPPRSAPPAPGEFVEVTGPVEPQKQSFLDRLWDAIRG